MRLFCAIRATVLLVCAAATASHADGLRSTDSTDSGATPQFRVASCNCPGPVYRRHGRPEAEIRQFRQWPPVSEVESDMGGPAGSARVLTARSYRPRVPDASGNTTRTGRRSGWCRALQLGRK